MLCNVVCAMCVLCILQCGSPVEEKLCSECKKMDIKTIIGGLNHLLRQDNKIRLCSEKIMPL